MTPDQLTRHAAQAPTWHDRPDRQPVPPAQWARDHWSTLAYLEARAVDHRGAVAWDNVQISRRNWPMLYAARSSSFLDAVAGDAAEVYGLRIKDTEGRPCTLKGHCEADAVMDLVAAGLVELRMPSADCQRDCFLRPTGAPVPDSPSPAFVTGHAEQVLMPHVKVVFTDAGWAVVGELRRHLAEGGATDNFYPATRPGVKGPAQ